MAARYPLSLPAQTMREHFVADGGLRLLLPFMERAADQVMKQAGWLLVSIAVDPQLMAPFIEVGGLRGLIQYASQPMDACQEEAAWALANLSTDAPNAEVLVEAGALPCLLGLCRSGNESVELQAVWALANLAVADNIKAKLQEIGALPLLVERLVRASALAAADAELDVTNTLQQLTRCIANLLVHCECRAQLVACGGMAPLLAMGSSPANEVRAACARALANLSFDPDYSEKIVEAAGLPVIISMLHEHDAPQVQQEAAWAVLNLSVSPANEPALIASGVLEPIAALLRVDNIVVQEQARARLFGGPQCAGTRHYLYPRLKRCCSQNSAHRHEHKIAVWVMCLGCRAGARRTRVVGRAFKRVVQTYLKNIS